MEFAKLKKEYADHLRVLVRRRGRLRHINFDYPLRVKLGVLVLVFFSLVSSWGLFKKNQKEFDPKLDFSGHNGVTLYERRFLEAKTMLPAQGVVGYVSD